MTDFETDYLIIGAGAVGLAFADTLIDEDPDCHITIVDRHAKPGGHWNDAYGFVALHQGGRGSEPVASFRMLSQPVGTCHNLSRPPWPYDRSRSSTCNMY